MSDQAVGAYVNLHFASSYQKVGTFNIVNGQKQGGNVATYFCLADGTVLNAVAGPVDAKRFIQEARWVVETRKAAITETKGISADLAAYFRKAHAERFFTENPNYATGGAPMRSGNFYGSTGMGGQKLPSRRPMQLSNDSQVQWLLAFRPSSKVSDIYKIVYQDILGERISNLPVLER